MADASQSKPHKQETLKDLLIKRPSLATANGRHTLFDVEMRFASDEFIYSLRAHRAVQMSMKFLRGKK